MHIAIVDDSKLMRDKILNILRDDYSINNITCFASIKEYENSRNHYDLLLLDVGLPNENGIEYINKNPQEHTFVIYVTSYEETMSYAFNINVIGFVIKKDIYNRLLLEVKKAEVKLNLIKTYSLKTKFEILKVKENQILYFYSEDSIVYVQLENYLKLIELTAKTLTSLSQDLSVTFYRANRNYIINLKKVQSLDFKPKIVSFSNNVKIKISRRLWEKFKIKYGMVRYGQ